MEGSRKYFVGGNWKCVSAQRMESTTPPLAPHPGDATLHRAHRLVLSPLAPCSPSLFQPQNGTKAAITDLVGKLNKTEVPQGVGQTNSTTALRHQGNDGAVSHAAESHRSAVASVCMLCVSQTWSLLRRSCTSILCSVC